MKKERIGLFGGTFNPVHSGHLRVAETVQRRLLLDKILFIPSYIPPHKDSAEIASAFHRLKMVGMALRSHPCFVPCSIEIDAQGKSYSIITLNKAKNLYPEALTFFILGVDSFLEIDTWKDYEKVLEQCFFAVTDRPGYRLNDAKKILGGKYREKMHRLRESEAVKNKLFLSYRIFLLPMDALNIASSGIRERVKRSESIHSLVSDEVEAYIKKNKLYRS